MTDEAPRPLSPTERGVLERLLSADFEGAAELGRGGSRDGRRPMQL